jgi:hypothetical protein
VCDGGVSRIITNDSKTFRLENLKLTVVSRQCIAPDGGSVGTVWISNLYRVSLLCGNSVELWARRGKSLRKVPVALCITECM